MGKWLDEAESKGAIFVPFVVQCINTPDIFWDKMVSVVARAERSWSLILSLPFLIKDTVIKWGPGPEPGDDAPSKKSGSSCTVFACGGNGSITGAKLEVRKLDRPALGGDIAVESPPSLLLVWNWIMVVWLHSHGALSWT